MQTFNNWGLREALMVICVRFAPTVSGQASIPVTSNTLRFGNLKPNKPGNGAVLSPGPRRAASSRCVRLWADLKKIPAMYHKSFLPASKLKVNFWILSVCAEASNAWEYRMDFGVYPGYGTITSKGYPLDLPNNVRMVSGDSSPSRCATDQREGNDKIVDLHPCETDINRTHVNHFSGRFADSSRWYQVKTSTSTSGGRRYVGRTSLIDDEIREVAVQRVSVSSQDEAGCSSSCSFGQGRG